MRRVFLSIGVLMLTLGARTGFSEGLSSYSGAQLFERFCASCHGAAGKGDGPVAPFFKLAPPDLTGVAQRHGGKFPAEEVRKIIDGRENLPPHGTRAMPIWGLEFIWAEGSTREGRQRAEMLITRLVEYLRSIQAPKSQPAPPHP